MPKTTTPHLKGLMSNAPRHACTRVSPDAVWDKVVPLTIDITHITADFVPLLCHTCFRQILPTDPPSEMHINLLQCFRYQFNRPTLMFTVCYCDKCVPSFFSCPYVGCPRTIIVARQCAEAFATILKEEK